MLVVAEKSDQWFLSRTPLVANYYATFLSTTRLAFNYYSAMLNEEIHLVSTP